ncbi:zinc knuckle CX2CX4HX4C containing protein, partial [Tanacetum coccineum]
MNRLKRTKKKVESGLSTPGNNIIFELFGISLKTYKDFEEFINNIELGKSEVWLELSEEQRQEVSDTFDINTKSTSYAGDAGAVTKDQPKVISNFHPLVADPVFNGVNISIPRKVVQKGRHGLKRIILNNKGFFFFKFDSRAGLEAVLEGSPWMIRNSSIILKKWSMSTSLLKEELTRIPIWVKLHDVPLQVYEEDVDVVTIGIPSLTVDDFTKETIRVKYEWRPPRCVLCNIFGHVHDMCPKKVVSPHIVTTSNVVTPTVEKTIDGFQTVGKNKKRKGRSKSTNGGQFAVPSVKQNVRYEPKANPSAPKRGPTTVG